MHRKLDSWGGGCRPLVGLDGCHLKGKFGGHILSATARDGNDNIFPVALGVVKQENKDSWVWFLQTFAEDIGRLDELNLVFISDRQKVIQFTCFLRILFVLSHYIYAFFFFFAPQMGRWCSFLFFGCFFIVFMITRD